MMIGIIISYIFKVLQLKMILKCCYENAFNNKQKTSMNCRDNILEKHRAISER
jgi:hypothetical protein